MAYSSPFTAVTGATITAAGWNTSGRDNISALWMYTTAGDIVYATSPTVLSRLAIGAARTVLTSTSSAPQWSSSAALKGISSTWAFVRFVPNQTFSGALADITGATTTLTLPAGVGYTATYTVVIIASITGYNTLAGSGRAFFVTGSIGGVADANPRDAYNGSQATPRNETLSYTYAQTGVASGSCVVKLMCQADSDWNYVTSGRFFTFAIAE